MGAFHSWPRVVLPVDRFSSGGQGEEKSSRERPRLLALPTLPREPVRKLGLVCCCGDLDTPALSYTCLSFLLRLANESF